MDPSRENSGNGKQANSNDGIEDNWSGREDLNLRPPGPETTEISQVVDFSIHVSGASTA